MSDIAALFNELRTAIYNASSDTARQAYEHACELSEQLEAAVQKEVEDAHQKGYEVGFDAGFENAELDA